MAEELPRVLALLTARSIEAQPVSKAPTIVNVTDHLVCRRLPTKAPLAFFASLDGTVGVLPVVVRVLAPDGELLHAFELDAEFTDPDPPDECLPHGPGGAAGGRALPRAGAGPGRGAAGEGLDSRGRRSSAAARELTGGGAIPGAAPVSSWEFALFLGPEGTPGAVTERSSTASWAGRG